MRHDYVQYVFPISATLACNHQLRKRGGCAGYFHDVLAFHSHSQACHAVRSAITLTALLVCNRPHSSLNKQMGSRLGRQKETVLFRHNDVQHLDTTLRNLRLQARSTDAAPSNIFVAVESVYSMDGDLAPLTEILDVAGAHGALVIVDEAHG